MKLHIGFKRISKGPLTVFSPATSLKVGVISQNFWTWEFKYFCHTAIKF